MKTVKAQETELSILQENFSQARAELKAATMKNGELKKSLDEATFQLRRRVSKHCLEKLANSVCREEGVER